MGLFEGIGFENFKVFGTSTYFETAPITILTGTNNSGKSSLLNGIKLLKENFAHVKKTFNPREELDLKSIMATIIDTGSLFERYGSLQQFISKGSTDDQFTISFNKKMISIDDVVKIEFKIRIVQDNLKTGVIDSISMTSLNTGCLLFYLRDEQTGVGLRLRDKDRYQMSFDFSFYFKQASKNILRSDECYKASNLINSEFINVEHSNESAQKLADEFNKKFMANYSLVQIKQNSFLLVNYKTGVESEDFLLDETAYSAIMKDIDPITKLYNFDFLWATDLNQKNIFEGLLQSYYNSTIVEASMSFSIQILEFLSEVNWCQPFERSPYNDVSDVNFILRKTQHTCGVGLNKFCELFTNYTRHSQRGTLEYDDCFEINERPLQNAIMKFPGFYRDLFKPLLQLIAPDIVKSPDQPSFLTNSPFDRIIPTKLETYVSDLIYSNMNLIQDCLSDFQYISFLPNNKIQYKRSYTFSDTDDFTMLVKKVESLPLAWRDNALLFVNKWLKEFGIADTLFIYHDKDSGNFKPYLNSNKSKTLLSDFGYGTSQLIPLFLKLVPENNEDYELGDFENPYNSRVLVIEEPETNLHPALQSKLADLFVDANKNFNTQIIVETHSEYLIRKLQFLTGKGVIAPEISQIYYFYHPEKIPEGEEHVKKININNDGSLTDNFGDGFFDEADKIALELFLINHSQRN